MPSTARLRTAPEDGPRPAPGPSPEEATADAVVAALRRIIRAVDVHSRHLLHRYGLTTPQLLVLRETALRGEATGNALARAVRLSPPTMAGIVARLVERGLLERRRDARDRRQVLLSLTPEGRRLAAAAPAPLHRRFADRFAALEGDERAEILVALDRLAEMMEGGDLPEE